MYQVTFSLKDVGRYSTFREAFKALYEEVQRVRQAKEIVPAATFYEGTWIHETSEVRPVMFVHCLEAAHAMGLLTKDGKLTY